MKYPAGNAPPRRLASPRKQARLDLRRRSASPEPEDDLDTKRTSPFWKWVILIALFHIFLICFVAVFYQAPKPTPPKEEFFTLVPPGNLTKGSPGPETAPKVSTVTPAPSNPPPTPTPPPPTPEPEVTPVQPVTPPPPAAVQPPPPKPTPVPPPVTQPEPLIPPPDKPVAIKPPTPKPKPKPAPPKPKVKVALSKADLTEVDTTDTATPAKSKPKPKAAAKKPSKEAPDKPVTKTTTSSPESTGLSKDEVAAKLAHDLQTSGVENAPVIGPSGAEHSQANPFADFYLSVRDQVMNKWQHPNLDDETAVNPEVTIHVEKDGRVPPDLVRLTRSSGNQSYDDSAMAAAKSLGNLLQPLPDGCPPDIHIDFKLTR